MQIFYSLCSILIGYLVVSTIMMLIFQFIIGKKICVGTRLTYGCFKTLYPYTFKLFIKCILYLNTYITILKLFNKKKFEKEMSKFENQKRYKLAYSTGAAGVIINVYCCKDCWEKHEELRVMEILTSDIGG